MPKQAKEAKAVAARIRRGQAQRFIEKAFTEFEAQLRRDFYETFGKSQKLSMKMTWGLRPTRLQATTKFVRVQALEKLLKLRLSPKMRLLVEHFCQHPGNPWTSGAEVDRILGVNLGNGQDHINALNSLLRIRKRPLALRADRAGDRRGWLGRRYRFTYVQLPKLE